MLVLSVLAPFVWWIAVGGEGPLSAMLAVVGVPLALGDLFQTTGTGLQVASRSSRSPSG